MDALVDIVACIKQEALLSREQHVKVYRYVDGAGLPVLASACMLRLQMSVKRVCVQRCVIAMQV